MLWNFSSQEYNHYSYRRHAAPPPLTAAASSTKPIWSRLDSTVAAMLRTSKRWSTSLSSTVCNTSCGAAPAVHAITVSALWNTTSCSTPSAALRARHHLWEHAISLHFTFGWTLDTKPSPQPPLPKRVSQNWLFSTFWENIIHFSGSREIIS